MAASDGLTGVMGVYRETTLVPRDGSPRKRRQVKGKRPYGTRRAEIGEEARIPPENTESSVGGKSKDDNQVRENQVEGLLRRAESNPDDWLGPPHEPLSPAARSQWNWALHDEEDDA